MKKITVCSTCGSPRVFCDAYAAINTNEVRTYDDTFCDDCERACGTEDVEVPDDFDVNEDTYDLGDES